MANVCTFELHLRGSRSNVLALVGELNGIYDLTEQSWQGSDEDGISYLKGECRWSVCTSMIETDRPIGLLSEELQVELEIYGYDLSQPDIYEHYHYKSGECIVYMEEGYTAPYEVPGGAWWDDREQTVRCAFRLTMETIGGEEVPGDYDPFLDNFTAMMADSIEVEDLKQEREILIGLLREHPLELVSVAMDGDPTAYSSHEAVADELLEIWWETNGMEIMDWAGPYNGDVARFTSFAEEAVAEMVREAQASLDADGQFDALCGRAMELDAPKRLALVQPAIAEVLAAATRFMGEERSGAAFAGELFIQATQRALTGASGVSQQQKEEVLSWFDGLLLEHVQEQSETMFRCVRRSLKEQAKKIACLNHICQNVADLVCIYALAVCSACGNEPGIPAVKKLRDTRPY